MANAMAEKSKPRRVATADRLDVRVMLDPHMGDIYARMAALPQRVRGRELLALARIAIGGSAVSKPVLAATQASSVADRPGFVGHVAITADAERSDFEALANFADAIPPAH